jgi:multidrug efflux pump subunit AcrB
MFFLSGVARFLFVPMAESVMFAMVFSFLLSRTLVPTMAKYLLRMHVAHGDERRHGIEPPRRSNPLVRFQHGFEAASCSCAPAITTCWRSPSSTAGCSSAGFLGFVAALVPAAPFLGRNFFPQVDGGQILMHVRAPVGMRIEETAARFTEVEKAIREIIPPAETGAVVDNIGTYLSSINTIYNNTGTIGESDGDIQISLNEGHAPTADYVSALREELPRAFPA